MQVVDTAQAQPADPMSSRDPRAMARPKPAAARRGPSRSRLASALYRRSSLPFRIAFTLLARVRAMPPRCLNRGGMDPYLEAHTAFFFGHQWSYGYQRVFDLVSQFRPETDPGSLRVLSLGPRTEIELYYLWLLFGFAWRNLVGVDLVSTSPKIELADMSVQLPFPDNAFDVIVACHCLEKSSDPERTRDEIRRVAKPGAWVLVGGDRPADPEGSAKRAPYAVRFFGRGVFGLIDLYGLQLEDIEYLNARSPHGFELIFRVST